MSVKHILNYGCILVMGCILLSGCTATPSAPEPGDQGLVNDAFQEVVCGDPHELYGCKPTLIDAIDREDMSEVKRLVEEEGVDVNTHYPYFYGLTPLMAAVQGKHQDTALYLLEQGAAPDDIIPVDPLKIAESHNLERVLKVLRTRRGPIAE